MSGPAVCSISGPVRDELKALRFRKTGPNSNNADSKAVILKIDRAAQAVVVDEVLEDLTPDELRSELPEHQPRFAVYTMKLGGDSIALIFSGPFWGPFSVPFQSLFRSFFLNCLLKNSKMSSNIHLEQIDFRTHFR